jgi:hypothetical protein
MRRMLNVRVLSEPIPFQRGRSHNAYISESVSIHHRWSYLFEATLPVLRRMHREDGDCLVCESPSGHSIAIPVWMTDHAVCAVSFRSGRQQSRSLLCVLCDHVHMCIAIPPKHPVSSVIGFLKGKSAIAIARLRGKERNFSGEHFWGSGLCCFHGWI